MGKWTLAGTAGTLCIVRCSETMRWTAGFACVRRALAGGVRSRSMRGRTLGRTTGTPCIMRRTRSMRRTVGFARVRRALAGAAGLQAVRRTMSLGVTATAAHVR